MQMASMLLHTTQHYSSVSAISFSSFGLKSRLQILSTAPASEKSTWRRDADS